MSDSECSSRGWDQQGCWKVGHSRMPCPWGSVSSLSEAELPSVGQRGHALARHILKNLLLVQGSQYLAMILVQIDTKGRERGGFEMAGSIIRRLGDVPAAQHGYFTRAQASAAGVPDFDLTRSVQRGLIDRVGHGVYRVAGAGDDPLAELRIALLRLDPERTPRQRAADPKVWVALQSAAKVHGFGVFAGGPHTFVSRGRIQPGNGTSVRRRSKGLRRGDWEIKNGFAVTTVSRTAADLMSDHVDGGHIGRFVSDALNAGAISMNQLCARLSVDPDEIEALLMQSGDHGSLGVDD